MTRLVCFNRRQLSETQLFTAIRCGACGYLLKTQDTQTSWHHCRTRRYAQNYNGSAFQ
jgi:hypothetical protein